MSSYYKLLRKIKDLCFLTLFNGLINLLPRKGKIIPEKEFGICSLLCHRDVKIFIYGVKSLFYQLEHEYQVYVINDGTLTEKDKNLLKQFLYIEIEDRYKAERKMKRKLIKYEHIQKYRFNEKLSNLRLKIDAWLLNKFNRFLYMDADVLFYRNPVEIGDWIEKNSYFNMYIAHSEDFFCDKYYLEFSLRKLLYKHFKLKMTAGFNSGLLLIHSKNELSLPSINDMFQFFDQICLITFGGLEECLLSIIMAKQKSKKLSEFRYISTAVIEQLNLLKSYNNTKIMHHYSWMTKDKYPFEAVKLAISTNFFRQTNSN